MERPQNKLGNFAGIANRKSTVDLARSNSSGCQGAADNRVGVEIFFRNFDRRQVLEFITELYRLLIV